MTVNILAFTASW